MPGSSADDLRWLLTSPPIFAQVRGITLMPCSARERIAKALHDGADVTTDVVKSSMPYRRRTPLGHRAEQLLARALEQCPGIELIAECLAIRAGGRTIGEIDLLYDDHARACRVHCEVSVRLLLQREPTSEWSAWCGTDPRQTLQDKFDLLRDHQLPLGNHPEVPRHPTWPIVHEALILGWLLQPADEHWPDAEGAATDHLRGWWLRHGIAEPLRSSRAARFAIIPSQDWLGPLRLPASTPVLAPGELSRELDRHFARHDHAVLVAEVIRAHDGGWQEIVRGAIVHRHWPKMPR